MYSQLYKSLDVCLSSFEKGMLKNVSFRVLGVCVKGAFSIFLLLCLEY